MRKNILYFLPFIIAFISCKEEQKPKVKYDRPVRQVQIKKDTTRLLVADLPIQFSTSNVLIYPVGELRVSDIKKGSYEGDKMDMNGFNVSSVLDEELTGYLQNVKFQEIGKDSLRVLTDKSVLIERMTYLKSKRF
ncbi:hypothetical protein [Flavobacterium oreochromis]|uniref:hypothetical protein n=1 Tax=Flavobacterium oreochromis TaxID=2906078 RepID=UPI0021649D00|nr:hypothetical protein [Flavobacterium oreochromis]